MTAVMDREPLDFLMEGCIESKCYRIGMDKPVPTSFLIHILEHYLPMVDDNVYGFTITSLENWIQDSLRKIVE